MKRLDCIVCVCALLLIGACAPAYADGPDGKTCYRAIPLETGYVAEITQYPQEIWYSAWTFDLPLAVTFTPENGKNDPAPEVELDFSCTSGYYKDSILCSLFCKTSGGNGIQIEMPYKHTLQSDTKDGKFRYALAVGERYRNLLLQMGISYNVEVFIKVKYKSRGVLSMEPYSNFTNCMDGPKFMRINDPENDTVHVVAKDKERHVIVPYVQWQEDTIIYKWTGESPCRLAVANTCDFDPEKSTEEVIQFDEIAPGGSDTVKAPYIYSWVNNKEYPNEAGMYFAKFYSDKPGVIKVEKAKQAVPDGKATMLRFGKTYALDANTTAIFAIPRSWDIDVKFSTPTSHMFSMVLSPSTNFEEDAFKTYSFDRANNGHWLGIQGSELKSFWSKVPLNRHYMYIRFNCSEATTVSPERWNASDCYANTAENLVVPDAEITVKKQSSVVYRFSYPQWKGGDMTIKFAISNDCYVYLADTCGMTRTKEDAPYWLKYKAKVKSSAPLVITAEEIASWENRLDEDGYFYALFYTDANSTNRKLSFTTEAPEETDPVYPAATVAVACEGSQVTVNVSEEQHITIWSESDEKVDEWDAVPDTPHVVNLTAGNYILEGKSDKIQLFL